MSKTKTDHLYTPQVSSKKPTPPVNPLANSQEQLKLEKRNSRSSDKANNKASPMPNPEEASGSKRARSLRDSQGFGRMVESGIQELIH